MTDIYIAYSRQDRERLRIVGDLLAAEGWDIWMDPAEPKPDLSPIADLKLGWSKAIVVVWSDSARRSEYVRSEAATGLYKNKLVQARIDGDAPPRPFDELEAVDLSRWNGDTQDPAWRKLVAMVRNSAGEPTRAPVQAAKQAPPPPRRKPEAATPPPIQFLDPPPAPKFQEPPQKQRYVEPVPPPPEPPRYAEPPPSRFAEPPPHPRMAEPPPRFAEPPPARFAEPPPQPRYAEQTRFAEPPPPPRYAEPPRHPRMADPPPRFAEPPPQSRYTEPSPPPPRYNETDTTRYADPAERRGPRLAESVYRVPSDHREERMAEPDFIGRRASFETDYNKQKRSFAAAPIVAAVALIGSGVGLWFGDPFGWRAGGGEESPIDDYAGIPTRTLAEVTKAPNTEPATGAFEDTAESAEDWRRTDRKSVDALRDHVSAFPRASTADSARSALRVMDAQAWVKAVTADSEAAYRTYLKAFPADGDVPGAMVQIAEQRVTALGGERSQAIEDIQRGLAALDMYDGQPTGEIDAATTAAMKEFAAVNRRQAPVQASATASDLRAFAEVVRSKGSQPRAGAEVVAAGEADRQRIAQAQAASVAATEAAIAPPAPGADSLALAQQNRMAEVEAWAVAERAGTVAAYQTFLNAYPASPRTADARAAMAKVSKAPPYSIDQFTGELRMSVEAARRAQTIANQRAAAARTAAQSADTVADAQTITGADGDRYRAQISGGAPNGLGVRTRGGGPNAGDRYRGELRNGQTSGVGVYEFADNPGNASARAARYEGEHVGDAASGHGVIYWKSGDNFAGLGAGGGSQARGVLTYSNGQRYEGDMTNGDRNGHGVIWGADGSVMQAGRWSRGELVDPATR